MTDDDRAEINAMLSKNLEEIAEEFTEQSARISALRFLLENMYADAYTKALPQFNALMDDLLTLTRTSPVKGVPMNDEAMQDLQVRIATHLTRFQAAVVPRIQRRSGD